MILHDGQGAPTFEEQWDPADRAYVWVCWDDLLEGATIATSNWQVPSNWTEDLPLVAQTVQGNDGTQYVNCNGIRLKSGNTYSEIVRVTNAVTFSDGREFERSVKLDVRDQ